MNFKSEQLSELKRVRKEENPRKKDFLPFEINRGSLKVYLARHFGFCFGVERAVEIAYSALDKLGGARVFLLSEMIHNPGVNADLQRRGVQFLCDTSGNEIIPIEEVTPEDTVILPAFGVSLEVEAKLKEQGVKVELYDTTCPFVERVWKRARQLGQKGYSIIIHGKPHHEETRATFSRAAQCGPALMIKTIEEAQQLAALIRENKSHQEFAELFGDRTSEGFNFESDLKKCGVVNQTTMLAEETAEVVSILREAIADRATPAQDGEFDIKDVFADTKDTLCYATSDNQNSVKELLKTDAELALVIGGFNSSNTTHLAKLCRTKFATYHVRGVEDIVSASEIVCRAEDGTEMTQQGWLPEGGTRIALTAGASTPDAVVEKVIDRLQELVAAH